MSLLEHHHDWPERCSGLGTLYPVCIDDLCRTGGASMACPGCDDCEDHEGDDYDDDLSDCPYFRRNYMGEDIPREVAVCNHGCWDEPNCVTCVPPGGWPALRSDESLRGTNAS